VDGVFVWRLDGLARDLLIQGALLADLGRAGKAPRSRVTVPKQTVEGRCLLVGRDEEQESIALMCRMKEGGRRFARSLPHSTRQVLLRATVVTGIRKPLLGCWSDSLRANDSPSGRRLAKAAEMGIVTNPYAAHGKDSNELCLFPPDEAT
jgi:hypothetical protein